MTVLPEVDATLNAASCLLLCLGFFFIKTGRWRAHGFTMVTATAVSTAFLICYLTNHYLHGVHTTVHSQAPHWLRYTYLAILFPHLFLAMVMLPDDLPDAAPRRIAAIGSTIAGSPSRRSASGCMFR